MIERGHSKCAQIILIPGSRDVKPNFGTIGPGRRWRDNQTHLKHPRLTDEAFTPLAAGELPTLCGDFDDIEAAERDAIEGIRKRQGRAPMLDEELDD